MTLYTLDESRTAASFTPGPTAGRGAPSEIVIHHWGAMGQTHDGVVSFFCSPGCPTSAHFVASAGRVSCLVSTTDVAWHAGSWDVNLRSVGIECRPEATDADYQTIAELIRELRSIYGNLPLAPHSAYAQTACPGKYDLARLDQLARKPAETQNKEELTMADIRTITAKLDTIISQTGPINTSTGKVAMRQFIADGTRAAQTAVGQTGPINRGGKQVSLKQEVADCKTMLLSVQATLAELAALVAKQEERK